MPQSLSAVYLHLVFSTKGRHPFLGETALRSELHRYLGGTAMRLGSHSIIVGGVEDHVHLLLCQSRTISTSDLVRDLKSNSSGWLRERRREFAWQSGYGVFSVGAEGLAGVRDYVQHQEEHHRKVTFQEEFRKILLEHSLDWDERYVWD